MHAIPNKHQSDITQEYIELKNYLYKKYLLNIETKISKDEIQYN